jgi:hypothetical protein
MSTARKFVREECARVEAELYLRKLRERIAYRQGTLERVRRQSEARNKWQSAYLRKQAEAYRRWLRRFLSPDQFEETTADGSPSETVVTRRMTLVQSGWYSDRRAGAAS